VPFPPSACCRVFGPRFCCVFSFVAPHGWPGRTDFSFVSIADLLYFDSFHLSRQKANFESSPPLSAFPPLRPRRALKPVCKRYSISVSPPSSAALASSFFFFDPRPLVAILAAPGFFFWLRLALSTPPDFFFFSCAHHRPFSLHVSFSRAFLTLSARFSCPVDCRPPSADDFQRFIYCFRTPFRPGIKSLYESVLFRKRFSFDEPPVRQLRASFFSARAMVF